MNSSSTPPTDRLDELLAESMVRALAAEETRELESLAGAETETLVASAEQAAVATLVAFADEDPASMPADLQSKLLQQAQTHFAQAQTEPHSESGNTPQHGDVLPGPGSKPSSVVFPWLLAAAASIAAIFGWFPVGGAGGPASASEQFQGMIAQAPTDMLRLDWTVLEDPASEGASGELLWSDTEQRGYMRFDGLQSNDPTVSQYQLWIFDDKTDTATPVDGGVFDIPAGTGEIIVAIDPKIKIKEAFQFAITVEKPGGVVVSKRERIPLLAAVPG